MATDAQVNVPESGPQGRSLTRPLIALLIVLAVGIYAVGIVTGRISAERKLATPDVVVLIVGVLLSVALWQPRLLDRLTHFKLGSVEFELEQLQKNQKAQQGELNDVRFVLTLLLQDDERAHLRNLKAGDTENYVGNHQLRTELRRLKAMGLICKLRDKNIADIKDGQKVDLKSVVKLTERGNQYLGKMGEFE